MSLSSVDVANVGLSVLGWKLNRPRIVADDTDLGMGNDRENTNVPLPPPLQGIFSFMLFVLFDLRTVGVCKIFISNGLAAKYWL
jgi:hypothetical protein